GWLDLATANKKGDSASVLLNLRDGKFLSPHIGVTAPNPAALAAADFDGDGTLDVVSADLASDSVNFLHGKGTGLYTGDVLAGYVGSAPTGIAQADFNGDGLPDVVTANSGSADLSLLLNLGKDSSGKFLGFSSATPPDTADVAPFWVSARDVNSDGAADLI